MLSTCVRLFPLWAIIISVVALFLPKPFIFLKEYIEPCLMLIMLSMGLTLSLKDFSHIKQKTLPIIVGVLLQFIVMPFSALIISNVLMLDTDLTLGMILVGSVAGGTASNVICYLARADVALSITMTAISTLLGIFMTPLLVSIFVVGKQVDVPTIAMLISLLKIVLFPVSMGIFLNQFLAKFTKKIIFALPFIAMTSIIIVIGIVVAINANNLFDTGLLLISAIIIHNGIGMILGYCSCRLLRFNEKICRTVAIEVAMQNSGLAIALGLKFFTPITALPGAIFSIWHNISGAIIAGIWSRNISTDSLEIEEIQHLHYQQSAEIINFNKINQ